MPNLPRDPHATAPDRRSTELLRDAHLLYDAQRMALGRAQIAAGNYIDIEDVDVYLDSLQRPPAKA
jgi:hypothetical protein